MHHSQQHPRQCRTCGQVHPIIPGTHSTDCILLGTRTHSTSTRSNSPYFPPPHLLTTIPIPLNIRSQALLFDQIWFWFVDMKHENDNIRNSLQSHYHIDKGTLRSTAPLLWFEWRRWDEVRGQTRNQENFDKVWKRLVWVDGGEVGKGEKVPVAWVTLRSVDSSQSSKNADMNPSIPSPKSLRRTVVT